MDQNLPDRAGGSGPLAASGPADPPGPLDYAPQTPAYASLGPPGSAGPARPPRAPAGRTGAPGFPATSRPAPSAFWDDQPRWDGEPDWEDGYRKPVSSATYWRRRAIALIIGLAVLGVIAWAVNGVLGGGKPTSPPPTPAGTHGHSHGGAKDLSGTHAKAHRHGKAAGRHRAHAGNAVGLGPRHGASTQPAATTSAVTVPGSAPPACAPGSVLLTLRSPSYWYVPRARPVFVVEAVSTGSQACRFNLGDRFVSVLVTSGPAAIWNSATCVPAAGSRVVTLRRGVPAFFRTTWDRRASPLGCRGHGDLAQPGTYTAVARDDHLRSQTIVFVLSGRGVAVP